MPLEGDQIKELVQQLENNLNQDFSDEDAKSLIHQRCMHLLKIKLDAALDVSLLHRTPRELMDIILAIESEAKAKREEAEAEAQNTVATVNLILPDGQKEEPTRTRGRRGK